MRGTQFNLFHVEFGFDLLVAKKLGDSRGSVKNEIFVGFDPYVFFLACLSFLRSCFILFFFFQTDLIDNLFTKRQKINK